jgi:hypothetical protein
MILGMLGSACYMFCSVVQLIQTIKAGNTRHLYDIYILVWSIGNVFTVSYVALYVPKLPLIINYLLNSIALGIIIYYRFYPRRAK